MEKSRHVAKGHLPRLSCHRARRTHNASNNIEIIICLVLLFMAVPDLCGKLGQPALVFPAFVVFGFLIGPLVNPQVRTMLDQAGQVGFLLLLFEVGLEIDLPRLREFIRPLRHAVSWALLQYPLALLSG